MLEFLQSSDNANESKIPLLWADDQIAEMRDHVRKFEEGGFEVTVAASTAEAKSILDEKKFAVALIDLLMPSDFGHALIKLIQEQHPQIKTAVLSGYLGTRELCDGDFFREHNVVAFDKDEMPSPADPEYERQFIDVVKKLAENRDGNLESESVASAGRGQSSVLKMSFEEYRKKTQVEKILIKRLARATLQETVQSNFKRGAIWVLVFGDRKETYVANEMRDVWSWQIIKAKCEAYNLAPFQYFADLDIDDFGWGSGCSGDLKDYPTVTLGCIADRKKRRAIHFDTGCPISIIESDAAVQLSGVEVDKEEPVELPIKTRNLVSYQYTLSCYLLDRQSSRQITIHGFAVDADEWYQGPLARPCNCRRLKPASSIRSEGNGVCYHRWGLVGRNLLTENKLKLILDGDGRDSTIHN